MNRSLPAVGLLRFGLSFLALSALFASAACGGDGDSGDVCSGTAPSCEVTDCSGTVIAVGKPSCQDNQWLCPAANEPACLTGDDGGPETDGGFACTDPEPLCGSSGGCNNEVGVRPSCTSEGWACPAIACADAGPAPVCTDPGPNCTCNGIAIVATCTKSGWACNEPACVIGGDGGPDAGPDASQDGGPAPDGGPDGGGDVCAEGASCDPGDTCTVSNDGNPVTVCDCQSGSYVCH